MNFTLQLKHKTTILLLLGLTLAIDASTAQPPAEYSFSAGVYSGLNTAPSLKGAQFIMPYGMVSKSFLDVCKQAGLDVLIQVPRGTALEVDPENVHAAGEHTPSGYSARGYIEWFIEEFSDHEAVRGIYLMDEPVREGFSPEQANTVAAIIRKHTHKPIYIVLAWYSFEGPSSQSKASLYADAVDVFMSDVYPFQNKEYGDNDNNHRYAGNEEFDGVLAYWLQHTSMAASIANNYGLDYIPVLQAAGKQAAEHEAQDSKYAEEAQGQRLPTLAEARYQSHLGVQLRSDSLIWFMYSKAFRSAALEGEPYAFDGEDWLSNTANGVFPKLSDEWNELGGAINNGEIVGGIRSVSHPDIMAQVYYDPEEANVYILALNRMNKTLKNVEIDLNLNLSLSSSSWEPVNVAADETSSLNASADRKTLWDDFDPFQARVYRLRVTEQPNTPAEAPELAATLSYDTIENNGKGTFSITNQSQSGAHITRVNLSSGIDGQTFATFDTFDTHSQTHFTTTPDLSQPRTNLLAEHNWGLEDDTQSIHPWWKSLGSKVTLDNTVGHNSGQSLLLDGGPTGLPNSEYKLPPKIGTNIRIPTRPGFMYYFGFWAKTNESFEAAEGQTIGAKVQLTWWDELPGAPGEEDEQYLYSEPSHYHINQPNTEWTFYWVQGVCPPNADFLSVSVYFTHNEAVVTDENGNIVKDENGKPIKEITGWSKGKLWLDDFEVYEYANEVTLSGSGFEVSDSNWQFWGPQPKAVLDSEQGREDSDNSMKLTAANSEVSRFYSDVIPGERYSTQFWVKTSDNFNGSITNYLHLKQGTDWLNHDYRPKVDGSGLDWVRITNSIVALDPIPDETDETGEADQFKFGALVKEGSSSSLTGEAWVDDFSIAHYPENLNEITLDFSNRTIAPNATVTTTRNRWIPRAQTNHQPDPAEGIIATVYFTYNGEEYRLQGTFRDVGDDDDNHHGYQLAELTNIKKARVELTANVAKGTFSIKANNNARSVKIKRVRLVNGITENANNETGVFDTFIDGTMYTAISGAGAQGDNHYSDFGILKMTGDGLEPSASAVSPPSGNYLNTMPDNPYVLVYMSDGSRLNGHMTEVETPKREAVSNYNFEQPLNPSTDWSTGANSSQFTYDVTTTYNGSRGALKCQRAENESFGSRYQDVSDLIPGARYTLSGMIKTENLTPTGSNGVSILYEVYDSNNSYLQGGWVPHVIEQNSDWVLRKTSEFTLDPAAHKLRVTLYISGKPTSHGVGSSEHPAFGTAYFDDIVLTVNNEDYKEFVFESE